MFFLPFSAQAEGNALLSTARSVVSSCKDIPEKIDKALNFLKEEVTYHTKLPLHDAPDWLPKPLMNEKLSLSYENMMLSRKSFDTDCQSIPYITALLPGLESGSTITADDTTLIEGISTRLATDIAAWKQDYTIFWKSLHETIQQYQENKANTTLPSAL